MLGTLLAVARQQDNRLLPVRRRCIPEPFHLAFCRGQYKEKDRALCGGER